MAKYRVGDVVIVKHDLNLSRTPPSVVSNMLKYRGREMTISRVTQRGWYRFVEDDDVYSWTDDMIEDLAPCVDMESFENFLLE